jgi:hypothetical protein
LNSQHASSLALAREGCYIQRPAPAQAAGPWAGTHQPQPASAQTLVREDYCAGAQHEESKLVHKDSEVGALRSSFVGLPGQGTWVSLSLGQVPHDLQLPVYSQDAEQHLQLAVHCTEVPSQASLEGVGVGLAAEHNEVAQADQGQLAPVSAEDAAGL